MTMQEMKDRMELKLRIIERAEKAGLSLNTRTTAIIDLDNADQQFNLRLNDWLAADDVDFAHDWVGIQANMNRDSGLIESLFVPRFADKRGEKRAQMYYIAKTISTMANRLTNGYITVTYREETETSVNDFTEYARQHHKIFPGEEYFFIWRGKLLYVVNVTADSPLTAAKELMDLIARKF